MIDSVADLKSSLQSLQERIEAELEQYVRPRPDCPQRLRDAMAYSLMAGGKRLRPLLVLLATEACGGKTEAALPAACALEMVHTYSLIHDDLPAMDDDQLRRGRPTCHIQFDEATAILAGDALLTLAFEIIAEEITPAEIAVACCRDLASAAGLCGMVGGQMADITAETEPVSSLEQLEAIHRRKTGRLYVSALVMGGRLGNATEFELNALRKYGESIGLAFQITDDLLDAVGDRAKMGKEVRKDVEHGKLTYPHLLGEKESRQAAAQLIDEARESLQPFGERGHRLDALATFILKRDH
ncbi:MAG: polyprenyl synthetase family protein [Planctomycetaceae bacterium]